jgi:hypothetical protein
VRVEGVPKSGASDPLRNRVAENGTFGIEGRNSTADTALPDRPQVSWTVHVFLNPQPIAALQARIALLSHCDQPALAAR